MQPTAPYRGRELAFYIPTTASELDVIAGAVALERAFISPVGRAAVPHVSAVCRAIPVFVPHPIGSEAALFTPTTSKHS